MLTRRCDCDVRLLRSRYASRDRGAPCRSWTRVHVGGCSADVSRHAAAVWHFAANHRVHRQYTSVTSRDQAMYNGSWRTVRLRPEWERQAAHTPVHKHGASAGSIARYNAHHTPRNALKRVHVPMMVRWSARTRHRPREGHSDAEAVNATLHGLHRRALSLFACPSGHRHVTIDQS
jgi:hypothetical protein